jgi:hypothetical protein
MWSINGIVQTLSSEQKTQVLIDTCTQLGFDIPRFCYHENLKIAGNCRMCLIEDSKAPKPVICCAGNALADLNIFTNTIQVKKSRESVMEFLLINHPLDCPICDQGGECDLQDLSLVYGADHGRFYDYKRNVEDKNCGPVVKTVMNRCILCTRCVRFATDIAGFETLGLTGRGGKMEIGSYVEKVLDSDLSGNLIDVCPVGALTSKPYSFISRPWELKKVNLFALTDDQPQFVRADIKENEIVRFLPAKNARGVNTWITNRTRFSYEGISRNRVIEPYIFGAETSWVVLLNTFKALLVQSLANVNLKQKSLFSLTFVEMSNFDYFDLIAVKKFLSLSGLTMGGASKLLSFTFLPRVTNFLENVNNAILINLDLNFELPITALLLQKCLIDSEKATPFVLNWRSVTTSILKGFALNLPFSTASLFNFFEGKTWFNSLFNSKQLTFNLSLCLYTFEWDYVLQNLRNKLFNSLILFLFTPTAAHRTLIDIDMFFKNALFEQPTQTEVSLIDWQLGGVKESNTNYSYSNTSLTHATHYRQDGDLTDLSFVLPSKSYIENNSIFYNLDYTCFRSFKAISSSNNCKTVSNIVKVLVNLLNLANINFNPLQPLIGAGLIIWVLEGFKSNLNIFLSLNTVLRKKYLSRTKFYQMTSVLAHSPTLSALQRSTFNLNIY